MDEAKRIIDLKREMYGDEGRYEQEAWGERVDPEVSERMIAGYLEEHGIAEHVSIKWQGHGSYE